MAVKRLSNFRIQYDDGNGALANAYRLFFYQAGSSTKQNTYNSSTGLSANTNPITLNSLGEPASEIWLTVGQSYKVVLAPPGSDDPPGAPVWTEDNVTGVNDASVSVSEWIAGPTPTYVSATQFTLAGDQTGTFAINRRIQATVTAGTVYGYISVSAFAALTTVTVVLDSGSLDSGLSAVSYALLGSTNPSVPAQYAKFTNSNSDLTVPGALAVGGNVTFANGFIQQATNEFRIYGRTGDTLTLGGNNVAGALTVFSGVYLGSATGGDKGAGTLNATGYYLNGNYGLITLGTPTVTTSGTAINITGIPTTAKRVTVNLKGVSTNGSANLLLQIGPSGGVETSGYSSRATEISSTGTNSSAGFILTSTGEVASSTIHGSFVLALENAAAFSWCGTGLLTDFANSIQHSAAGSKSTASAITQLTLTTVGGTDTFDAGEINITYE